MGDRFSLAYIQIQDPYLRKVTGMQTGHKKQLCPSNLIPGGGWNEAANAELMPRIDRYRATARTDGLDCTASNGAVTAPGGVGVPLWIDDDMPLTRPVTRLISSGSVGTELPGWIPKWSAIEWCTVRDVLATIILTCY